MQQEPQTSDTQATPPAVLRRMCAHCRQWTGEPVVVGGVERNSGPGWPVYACPEHAHRYRGKGELWAALLDHALGCASCRIDGADCAVAGALRRAHAAAARARESGAAPLPPAAPPLPEGVDPRRMSLVQLSGLVCALCRQGLWEDRLLGVWNEPLLGGRVSELRACADIGACMERCAERGLPWPGAAAPSHPATDQ
ncbi:hypothetical protein [Streptomyces aidingensis]|uniref:Uncharacterized protein n=1 Tax=Streptomyces aidingensis TaxID=910347 RepID=A0A1I1K1R6_9ACTN|nr:hypothetical protein [Streptomyces aidingensis]SFC54879.1 hypothetical protein SAMN05421773_10454 [Streptomyces aidingensis]